MRLYLSSYKIGEEGEKLAKMLGGKKLAMISNSLDCYSDLERRRNGEQEEIEEFKKLGIKTEIVDLRDFFANNEELSNKLDEFGGVWVRGGNVFVLRVAMAKSGFDKYIASKTKDDDFVYAGYSAGPCVLGKSLEGFEIVDSPEDLQNAYLGEELIWDGLGLIDFVFVPHYKSDHPESAAIDKEVEYHKKHGHAYKTFRDREVFIKEQL